ncbi:UNVERIFIED_CONTAM: hypothetical protein FKN15_071290 [Acipenser sinensis]
MTLSALLKKTYREVRELGLRAENSRDREKTGTKKKTKKIKKRNLILVGNLWADPQCSSRVD